MKIGRPRQPVDLIIANGKKHLTKLEIENRKSTEVKAKNDNIEPPSRLTKKQKDRFNYWAAELLSAQVLTNLDVESLARYVALEEQYNKITKKINKLDVLDPDYDEVLIKQTKVYTMLSKSSNELCLNILSRSKVVVPKKEDNSKKNKFEKFGVGNG
ncbi:P27 family phage terminase small subunit [Clostridium frigidicarnis]|uniref:P27 family phage terminase small subunit n=1 Tax=Clostridium frigidicarnis TaxID=84698 RepID=UPI0015A68D97|nr:P27 family phage terminase small subunit [Clostridium frigidicarnis]